MVFSPPVFASHLSVSRKNDRYVRAERGGIKERDVNKDFVWFNAIVKI